MVRCRLPSEPVTSRISSFLSSRWTALGIFAVGLLWLGWQSLRVAPPAVFLKYPVLSAQYLEGTIRPDRLLDVSFLYFYIHVAARWLTSNPELLVQLAQVAASSLAAALLFSVVSRLASPTAGLVASVVLLLDRTLAVYTPILEPEPFLLLAVVALLYFSTKESNCSALATGVALGCAILFRPVLVPMVFLVPFHYWLSNRSSGQTPPSTQRQTVLFLLPVVFAFGLLWGRNVLLPIPFSATVMNPGSVFYEGNHPWATGLAATYPPLFAELRNSLSDSPDPQHELYRVFARRSDGADLSVAEVNEIWRGRAVSYLRDHPGAALKRAGIKLNEVFRGYAWHDLSNAYWRHQELASRGIPAVSFALVAAAGLIGMALVSRNWDRWLLLYGVVACQLIAMTLVYVSARQKLVMVPLLAAFAAVAVVHISRRLAGWAVHGFAIVLLAVLLWLPNDRSIEDRYLWGRLQQSNEMRDTAYALRSEGRHDEAAEAAARALALTPWRLDGLRPASLDFGSVGFAGSALDEMNTSGFAPTFSFLFDKATLALAAGEGQIAVAALDAINESDQSLARGSYQSSQLAFYRAQLALLQGDEEGAISLLDEALLQAPGDPSALALQAALTRDVGYESQLQRYFGPVHAKFFLGKAHLENGDPRRAAEAFAFVVERIPEFRRARIYLAAALGAAGKVDQGVGIYLDTVSSLPDPMMLEEEIVEMFRHWLDEDVDDPKRRATVEDILLSFAFSLDTSNSIPTP